MAGPPHLPVYPPGAAFGDPALGPETARLGSHLIAAVVGGFIPALKLKARKLRSHGTHRGAGVVDWQAHHAARAEGAKPAGAYV